MIRALALSLTMCLAGVATGVVSAAVPAGFSLASDPDSPLMVYRDSKGVEVRLKSMAALMRDNSTDPDLRSDDARTRLESALYIMDLGLPEITATLDDNPRFPMVQGTAYTEDGDDVFFTATWQGRPGEDVLVLVLNPVDSFDAEEAKKIMRGGWRREYVASHGVEAAAARPPVKAASAQDRDETPAPAAAPSPTTVVTSRRGYPVPAKASGDDKHWAGWHYVGTNNAVGREGDLSAPRARLFSAISPTAKGPDVALKLALDAYAVDSRGHHAIVELQVARTFAGDPAYITLGKSRLNGQPATFFAQIYQGSDSSDLSVLIIEADNDTYADWGAIASALSATGVIERPSDVPEAYRRKLAAAPFDQQLAFYHIAYTDVMNALMTSLIAINMNTLNMMQNMNYDLLFDGEISLETITNSK